MNRTTRVVLAAGVLAVALAGCGPTMESAAHHEKAATQASAVTPTGKARATGLVMGMPSGLGQVLTDDYMMTLYRSDRDAPSKSTCVDACARTWLPVLAPGPVTFEGGDRALLGTITRPDGAKQLTVRGYPVYRYAGDRAEGDTKGQGVDGVWFAVSPKGAKISS